MTIKNYKTILFKTIHPVLIFFIVFSIYFALIPNALAFTTEGQPIDSDGAGPDVGILCDGDWNTPFMNTAVTWARAQGAPESPDVDSFRAAIALIFDGTNGLPESIRTETGSQGTLSWNIRQWGGNVADSVRCLGRINIGYSPATSPANILTFLANPDTVFLNNLSNLSWTANGNISTCGVNDDTNGVSFLGYGANDDFDTPQAPAPQVDYTLTCYSVDGNDTAPETVIVNSGGPGPWIDGNCGGPISTYDCSIAELVPVGSCTTSEREQHRLTQFCGGTRTDYQYQCVPDASCGGGGPSPSITSFTIDGGATASITEGSSAQLAWSVENVVSCDILNAETFSNIALDTGNQNTNSGLTSAGSPYTYRLECDDGAGNLLTRSVTLNIGVVVVPTPQVVILSIPQQVHERRTATVIWNATDVTGACTLSKERVNNPGVSVIPSASYTYTPSSSYNSSALTDSNSYTTLPITESITYTATCPTSGAPVSGTVTVNPFKLKIEEN